MRKWRGVGTLVFCGKSIGSYASQLALSCEARLWYHKAGFNSLHAEIVCTSAIINAEISPLATPWAC